MHFQRLRRREFITLAGAAALSSGAARAQGSKGKFEIGFLYPGPQSGAPPRIKAFSEGLQAGGLAADRFTIVPRVTGGDAAQLAPMAQELVARKVDLIHAISPGAIRAAQAATRTIPIVVSDLESDPVAAGFIKSHARPGGNITGCFLDFPDFAGKLIELLRDAVGQVSPAGVLWDEAGGPLQITAVQKAADSLGIKAVTIPLRHRGDLEPAFQRAVDQNCRTVIMLSSPFAGGNTRLLAEQALNHRLASISFFTHYPSDGGLMAYGPNLLAFFNQIGQMATKLLRGTKAAELPIETPARFEFTFNMTTARALGLNVPPGILLRADQVVDG